MHEKTPSEMGVNGLLEVKEEKNIGVTTRNQVRVCDSMKIGINDRK